MRFFLDRNTSENFWTENKDFRTYLSKAGTGIYFTGIRKKVDYTYEPKDVIEDESDLLDARRMKKIESIDWHFHPKAVHYRDFYIDDAAVGQRSVQYAQDCIYKEKVSMIDFRNRYNNPRLYKNVDKV